MLGRDNRHHAADTTLTATPPLCLCEDSSKQAQGRSLHAGNIAANGSNHARGSAHCMAGTLLKRSRMAARTGRGSAPASTSACRGRGAGRQVDGEVRAAGGISCRQRLASRSPSLHSAYSLECPPQLQPTCMMRRARLRVGEAQVWTQVPSEAGCQPCRRAGQVAGRAAGCTNSLAGQCMCGRTTLVYSLGNSPLVGVAWPTSPWAHQPASQPAGKA